MRDNKTDVSNDQTTNIDIRNTTQNQSILQARSLSTDNIAETKTENIEKRNFSKEQSKYKCLIWILISIVAVVIIAAVIIIIIVLKRKKDPEPKISPAPSNTNFRETTNSTNSTNQPEPDPDTTISIDTTPKTEPTNPTTQPEPDTTISELEPLSKTIEIPTKVKDLKRISVVQKSLDESKFNDQKINTEVTRKTNYDIYFINEEEAPEDEKHFYSKMYTGAISISSECFANGNEDCTPEEMVDLTKIKVDSSKLRLLDSENVNFKEVPLAICLFNITDNDFITSITCHEKFPEIKKNEMILDLYFFRIPAIEKKNETRDNITVTKYEDIKNNRKVFREQNGGLCQIKNNWGSLCTTDMNVTTDLDGNLLAYDEVAITNIVYDKKNSFTKNKISNLKDHSENITESDAENYRISLENLLKKMKNYMVEDIQFPKEKFKELYDLVKNQKTEDDSKNSESNSTKRRLLTTYDAIQYIKQKELLHIDSLGVEVNLNLKINSGLNTDSMKAISDFSFDEEEHNIYNKEHLSDIQIIIDKLKVLSKAGNYLATQLYDKISEKLEELPEELSLKLRSVYDLIKYYDLFQVFNSTLVTYSYNKLPKLLIELSTDLKSKLKDVYINGDIKSKIFELSDLLDKFLNQSHKLVFDIYYNIKALDDVLLNKNNSFVEITNYYLNNTSVSYIKLIEKSFKVFQNYYWKEFNSTFPKIMELINMFEYESEEALKSEREYILDMYTRLMNKSYTIVDISDSDFQLVLSNLLNIYNYTLDIIVEIRKLILIKVDIKDSGYYLTKEEIRKNNETFYSLISEIQKVLVKLTKDDLIDKMFDEIIIRFKDSFLNTLKYMDEKKLEYFILKEDVLNESLFSKDVKNDIETTIKKYTENILSKMNREIEYKKKVKNYIDEFISQYLTELNEILSELEVLYSEEALENIIYAFEISLNKSLLKISTDIDNNEKLTKEYFDHFYNIIYNDTYLLDVLKNYHVEEIPKIKYFDNEYMEFQKFLDEIYRRERTTAYLTKYNQIVSNWNYNDKYLKNQLYYEILEDYKQIFNNIKNTLQSAINIEALKNYIDSDELDFYNSHAKIIEKLQNKIDAYFSDKIFEEKYSKYIENLKTKYETIINTQKTYINNRHTSISKLPQITDYVYDFCIQYKRKICYGCTNCVWNTFDYGRFCIVLSPYENNYLDLKQIVYDQIQNTINYNNSYLLLINQRVNKYKSILENLQQNIIKIKNETLDYNFNYSIDYLKSYAEWVQKSLNEKFKNVIIQKSYDYYSNYITLKVNDLLNNITERWKTCFKNLYIDVRTNYKKIKYTFYELTEMAQIYQTMIETDLINNYFESIQFFQKTEFNYSITHYYDYFYKLVNKSYTYILANLPKEETEYNEYFREMKNRTLIFFNLIFNNISESEDISLNLENQKGFLKVNENDFFKINSTINTKVNELDEYIYDVISDILDIELFFNNLDITQYSLTTRFYLENREFGRLLEELYKPLDEGNFFSMNLNKFKEMMIENWIFDGNDFSNLINDALYLTNKEIRTELNTKMEEYYEEIEGEININLGEDIEEIIKNLYTDNIKDLNNTQITEIKKIIRNILDSIKVTIKNCMSSIKTSDNNTYYTLNDIENTMNLIKNYVYTELNNTLAYVVNEFYQNIQKSIYFNYVKNSLQEYLEYQEKILSEEKVNEFTMLNSSYKIGDLVYNLTSEVVDKYDFKTQKTIYFKYLEFFEKIKSSIDFPQIKLEISEEIDQIYKTEILSVLEAHNEKADKTKNVVYDLDKSIKIEINKTIETSMSSIKNIVVTTEGSNFKVEFKYKIDVEVIEKESKVIKPIYESIKEILSVQKKEQITKINTEIQNIIISNLRDFLNNVIPFFGNDFFNRIVDYNLNFKVLDLYDNLHYHLAQLFLYYSALGNYKDDVKALPIDLKKGLLRLNHIDKLIDEKRDNIIDLLDEKLNELIDNLKGVVKEKYTSYLKENTIIQNAFSTQILEAIDENLFEIMPQLEKEYNDALEIYLKKRFKNRYENILNEKTDEIIEKFRKDRERLNKEMDDVFSEEIDNDLHEVNENFDNTRESIRNYYKFLRTFNISEDLKEYFKLYANNSIVPLFQNFRDELNRKTFELIKETINNNSAEIEKINQTEFYYKMREFMDYFEKYYYSPIKEGLFEYGYPSYNASLEERRKELLISEETRIKEGEEDSQSIEILRQESKDVEETFEQLYNLGYNAYIYYLGCSEYSYMINRLTNNNKILNLNYKYLRQWIIENKYIKEIHQFLMDKLDSLNLILSGYYSYSKTGLNNFRSDMGTNIYTYIFNKIDLYRNITANTLNKEYFKILNTTKDFYVLYKDIEGKTDFFDYKRKTEHMINRASGTLINIKGYSEFEFNTTLLYSKNGSLFKTPRVFARIIDRTRPENLDLNIRSEYGFCGRTSFLYNVNFTDANFTMTIDYNTKSNNINITTYTDFDKYYYSSQMYQIPEKPSMDNITYMGYTVYFQKSCYSKQNRNLSDIYINEVEAKNYSETMIIIG